MMNVFLYLDKLNTIADRFFNFFTQENEAIRQYQIFVLFITMIASMVLSIVMVNFRPTRPLDRSLMYRELAFFLVLVRLFAGTYFRWQPVVWSVALFTFLCISVFYVLVALYREHHLSAGQVDMMLTTEETKRRHCLDLCEDDYNGFTKHEKEFLHD